MGVLKSGRYASLAAGMRRGSLVLIRELRVKDRFGRYYVRCRCDCGKSTKTRKHAFVNGRTKSCGCLQRTKAAQTALKKRKGFGESSLNVLYWLYRRGAQARGLVFDLDRQFFANMTKQVCAYCGCAPGTVLKRKNHFGAYTYNGIDRKDPAQGYVRGNVVACCKRCNFAKGSMGYAEFRAWVRVVHAHFVAKAV